MLRKKIGVAITVHNKANITLQCLQFLEGAIDSLYIVVVDDGSTDGTAQKIKASFPNIKLIPGDGNLWWTGGTNLAISECLSVGCDYILLLNPDVVIETDAIFSLVGYAKLHPNTVVAPIVVSYDNPEIVWWAGSQWGRVFSWLPLVWTSRYIYKNGTPLASLCELPYFTSEAHGRGVLVPREVFEKIGLYDQEKFPHYGADTDFSFRVWKNGFQIVIIPQIKARLFTENTGLKVVERCGKEKSIGYWNYLTKRKNGEAATVWWRITRNHLPWYSAIVSYFFIMLLNTYRYWFKSR